MSLKNQASAQSSTPALAGEAKIIAVQAYTIFGLALQASPGFQPTVGIQAALGHAQDAIETMVLEHLVARDQYLKERILTLFETVIKLDE